MRKNFQFITALFLALTFIFMTVAPAFAAGPRYLTLVDIQHWSGKGLVLKFEVVNGEYTPQELKGSYALIGNNEFGIDCNIDDDGKVVCVIGDAIAQYTGGSATVIVAGQGFYITVPGRKGPAQYCYNIYGLMTDDFDGFVAWMEEEEGIFFDAPKTVIEEELSFEDFWYPAKVGVACSDQKPELGDIIDFDHPYESELEELFGPIFSEEFFETCARDEDCPFYDLTLAVFLDESLIDEYESYPDDPIAMCFMESLQEIPAYYGLIYLLTGILFNEDCLIPV